MPAPHLANNPVMRSGVSNALVLSPSPNGHEFLQMGQRSLADPTCWSGGILEPHLERSRCECKRRTISDEFPIRNRISVLKARVVRRRHCVALASSHSRESWVYTKEAVGTLTGSKLVHLPSKKRHPGNSCLVHDRKYGPRFLMANFGIL
jgi:hypothetical protein